MDPYSAEGELVNIHTAFHQSQFQEVIDFDTSSFSSSNALATRVLQLRAQLALHQHDEVLSSISDSEASSTPDLAAVRITADYLSGKTDSALTAASTLAESHSDNLTVQLLISSIFIRAGNYDTAHTLLSRATDSLDATALLIQLHLLQNRPDLASTLALSARSYHQDTLLVNLAESWIGMRVGGEQYQQAFYVFEELAQSQSQSSVRALVAQAVSEIHLGRLPEAEVALQMALEGDGEDEGALANSVVLYDILGDEGKVVECKAKLGKESELLRGLEEKRALFEAACAKYSPKFEP